MDVDVVLIGGSVIDGTGSEAVRADVAITDGSLQGAPFDLEDQGDTVTGGHVRVPRRDEDGPRREPFSSNPRVTAR